MYDPSSLPLSETAPSTLPLCLPLCPISNISSALNLIVDVSESMCIPLGVASGEALRGERGVPLPLADDVPVAVPELEERGDDEEERAEEAEEEEGAGM